MSKGLKIAEPPRRRSEASIAKPPPPKKSTTEGQGMAGGRKPAAPAVSASPAGKFAQVQEDEKVQFNKRITRGVADGYEMLAIKTRRKVPDLLAEALELLEERYGKV